MRQALPDGALEETAMLPLRRGNVNPTRCFHHSKPDILVPSPVPPQNSPFYSTDGYMLPKIPAPPPLHRVELPPEHGCPVGDAISHHTLLLVGVM